MRSKADKALATAIAEQTEVVRKEQEKLDSLILQKTIAGSKISWPAVTTAAQQAGMTIADVVRKLGLDPATVLQIQNERKRSNKSEE